mmetsp:Transcript_26236/g.73628  ORF Transcript_26236/g.73628 Transcript_26236/m.73628 type:complete len:235 (-) Transcript_26236:373-1077(-)
MKTLLPPKGIGTRMSSRSMGVRGTMVPSHGSVPTSNFPGSTFREEQMRSTMQGMTSIFPLRSSPRLSTASWSFSQANSLGRISLGSLSLSFSTMGPTISHTLGPMEQLKEVASFTISSHSGPGWIRTRLLPAFIESFMSAKLSAVMTVNPPEILDSPLMTTSTVLSLRRASASPGKGGCMIANGTLLLTMALKTSPRPSFPAPKCTWNPSVLSLVFVEAGSVAAALARTGWRSA